MCEIYSVHLLMLAVAVGVYRRWPGADLRWCRPTPVRSSSTRFQSKTIASAWSGLYVRDTSSASNTGKFFSKRQRLTTIKRISFSCVRGASPRFQHVCIATANLSGRAGLHSAGRRDLVVLTTTSELGKRSFHVAAPVIWNSLPEHLRSHSTSKGQCRCGLKTHFFQQAYSL